jgi:hypothetical protein
MQAGIKVAAGDRYSLADCSHRGLWGDLPIGCHCAACRVGVIYWRRGGGVTGGQRGTDAPNGVERMDRAS